MPWTSKASGLAVIAASALLFYVVLSSFVGSSPAFAEVVEVLNGVNSATWKTTTEVKGPQNEIIKWNGTGMFLAPSHERTEMTSQGHTWIQIVDGQKDQIITLDPAAKTVSIINIKNVQSGNPFGKTFQGLRALIDGAQKDSAEHVERLGVETIEGRRAQGFRIQQAAVEIKIWADAETLLPVRVEQSTSDPAVRIVMTDFQIGLDLDESLFSLDVPTGYAVQQTTELDVAKKPITYLAEILKIVAEHNDGVFPPTLRGEQGIDGIMRRAATSLVEDAQDPADGLKRISELSMTLGGALGFLFSLSPENDWHYAGKDVQLNTPDRPIFWYRRHKMDTSYFVLYADLSIKEVAAAEVPKGFESEGNSNP